MFKTHKKQLILSSVIILLPVLIGLLLWNILPDQLATHWGVDGQPDGWGTKAFAVFLIPLISLATQWFGFWITTLDPKAEKQNKKIFGMIFWFCPLLSNFCSGMMYAIALGWEFSVSKIMFVMMGLMFIGIGNYMPKCRQNYTIGIKVSWALANEENWNATHRFAGKVWFFGGIGMAALFFLPEKWAIGIMFVLILILAAVPILYSYLYYRKQREAGAGYEVHPTAMDAVTRKIMKAAMIFTALILILVAIFLLTGSIRCTYGTDSFTVEASYWNDLTVNYDKITDLELRSGNVSGFRNWGIGSFRLLLGFFENDEFGNYTRYTYVNPEACVIVTCGEKVLVLSGKDAAETQRIYDELTARIAN